MSGRRKKAYSVAFKLSVVSKTETSSIRAVAREAGVDEKRVREWKGQEMEFKEMMQKQGKMVCKVRKRIRGGWQKSAFPKAEVNCRAHFTTESPACSCVAQGCRSYCQRDHYQSTFQCFTWLDCKIHEAIQVCHKG